MPGEGAARSTGWTVDTLHAHLDTQFSTLQRYIDNAFSEADKRYGQRFEAQQSGVQAALAAQEKAVQAALTASDRAIEKAETNSEKWRANANEWRAAMDDRERNFMPRSQAELAFKNIEDKLNNLGKSVDESRNKLEGQRSGGAQLWIVIFGVVSLGVSVVAIFLKH